MSSSKWITSSVIAAALSLTSCGPARWQNVDSATNPATPEQAAPAPAAPGVPRRPLVRPEVCLSGVLSVETTDVQARAEAQAIFARYPDLQLTVTNEILELSLPQGCRETRCPALKEWIGVQEALNDDPATAENLRVTCGAPLDNGRPDHGSPDQKWDPPQQNTSAPKD